MLLDLLANQPPDFFHDPFGQFIINVVVAVLVGIVTAVVAIWVFRKQRSKKEISYQIISDAPIASISKGFEKRVTIQLDGKPVKDVRQVVIKIRNSGNAAVKRDDYDKQLKFIFEGSEIIGGDVLSTEPESLIALMEKDMFVVPYVREQNSNIGIADTAVLTSTLLNPKNSITFTILLKGAYKTLEVRGMIVDGEIVKYVDREMPVPIIVLIFGLFLCFLGIIGIFEGVVLASFYYFLAACLFIAGVLFIIFRNRFPLKSS